MNVNKVIRLGEARDSNKPRPLLISLSSAKQKWDVLKNGSRLKNSEEYKGLFITKDLTKEEREKDKALRMELIEKRASDANYVIKNGQIVKRTPQNSILGDFFHKNH